MSEKYLGIPEIALPGLLTLPEIRFAENKAQQGYAKIGLVVLDAKSKTMLGQGGTSSALSDDNNWYVLGVGPFQNGSLRNEINYASQSPPGVEQRIIPRNVAFGRGGSTSGLSGSRLRLASGKKEMARESNADWERE